MSDDYETPRDPVGDLRAIILAHDVQAAIDGGRRPCRGKDIALIDVERVLLQGDLRIALLELVSPRPMRRRRTPVEQSGLGQHERSQAQADDPRAARMGRFQRLRRSFSRIAPGRITVSASSRRLRSWSEHEQERRSEDVKSGRRTATGHAGTTSNIGQVAGHEGQDGGRKERDSAAGGGCCQTEQRYIQRRHPQRFPSLDTCCAESGDRDGKNDPAKRSATPLLIATSAMLKAGQCQLAT